MSFHLTTLSKEDHPTVASLIHRSLVDWYESRLRQGHRFGDSAEPFMLIPEVYEALDPNEAIVARDDGTQNILGVCFVHPRETHFSIGIVATSPEAAGRGVARAMMNEALHRAEAAGKPVRLVSSLLNLDSFSLYTKLGFVPRTVYQDLLITVPTDGMQTLSPAPKDTSQIRLAKPDEAARLADYEASLQGIRRERDYQFFLDNQVGKWQVWVSETPEGELDGVLVIGLTASTRMLGPGVATHEHSAAALIWHALDTQPNETYVVLVPATSSALIQTLYRWRARNIELHVAQAYGDTPIGTGISFPVFLPESA